MHTKISSPFAIVEEILHTLKWSLFEETGMSDSVVRTELHSSTPNAHILVMIEDQPPL